MAFSQWTFEKSANIDHGLSLPGINGDSKLKITLPVGSFNNGLVGYVSTASGLTRGILNGVVRTLIRFENMVANNFGGVFCMASSLLSDASGVLYALQIENGISNNVEIKKASSSGIIGTGSGGTSIGSTGSVTFQTSGDIVAVELSWDASNQIGLGGTRLIGRIGTATDFSDLSTFTDTVDTTSPLTTSVTEGIFAHFDSGTSGTEFDIDDTSILINS